MENRVQLRALLVALLLVGLAFAAALPTPAGARVARWHKCSGTIRLSYGDLASRISARGLSCRRARRAIKAPASKLGYHCSNPFDRPKGSGGWIICRRLGRVLKFLYTQS